MSKPAPMPVDIENEIESQPSVSLLYHGIKNLLRCDEAEVVNGIARYVMSQHDSLRVGSDLMERRRGKGLPGFAAIAGATVRFLEVVTPRERNGVLWIARLSNERAAINNLMKFAPDLRWTELKLRRRPDLAGVTVLPRSLKARRIRQIAEMLHRRYEFFKVLRAVELIGYYTRFLKIFQQGNHRLAVMSSHSNPHGIAFNLAARRSGVPVILVSHGMPVRPIARLHYDLAVVHSADARQTYVEEGSHMQRVIVHGRKQDYEPFPVGFPERLRVGIFLCKDVNQKRLRVLVEQLLASRRVASVLVRPHPKNLWRGLDDWISTQGHARLSMSSNTSVQADLAQAELILAGNSSVLVDSVIGGRPAAYIAGLDSGPDDMHRLVLSGLVPRFCNMANEALNERQAENFLPERILRFYERPEWPNILRRFGNIDEDEATVLRQAGEIMQQIASRQSA
jgi:hypothetical protein